MKENAQTITIEEFRKRRREAEELKKEIPPLYADILRQYETYKMLQLKNGCLLDMLYYELENVKGIDYTKEKGTYNKDAAAEKYYSISDRIAEVEKENVFISSCIDGLTAIKDSIQDAELKAKATECYFNVI